MRVRRYVPICASLLVLLATLFLWQGFRIEGKAQIEAQTQVAIAGIKADLIAHADSDFLPLVRLARRWEQAADPLSSAMTEDAEILHDHINDYVAIAWIDEQNQLQWVSSDLSANARRQLHQSVSRSHHSFAAIANDGQQLGIASAIECLPDRLCLLLYAPLWQDERPKGAVVGVVPVTDIFDNLSPLLKQHHLRVLEGDTAIYASSNADLSPPLQGLKQTSVSLYGSHWQLQLWPKQSLLVQQQSSLMWILLGMGGGLALLVGGTLQLSQIAQRRALSLVFCQHLIDG